MSRTSTVADAGLKLGMAGVMQTIPLPKLAPMACAAVSRIDASDADIDRLKAMGVCIGRKVELVQAGDPLILRVLGSRLGVSARLAQQVYVDVCTAQECQKK